MVTETYPFTRRTEKMILLNISIVMTYTVYRAPLLPYASSKTSGLSTCSSCL